ncbi:precorrin-6A reductase [Planomonospora parontospora subsp. parontospora]|uniref:Precorrin-6A reductase n=2 Tax=Planomonospora parontospora TaxID=58119 RepID=A0AA37BLN9_9ACTN|nr:cobalt-precorrin-6A reductase [Planomonospora parontospora]GGK89621.1 precorrin-6A reductase [Planomonospora parontospora]GII11740.1 precorrin-6A reductase [Planomonospora parontospora subsp. parontospora]
MLNVLVLGGTDEARRLAAALAGRAGTHVVSSLAGRVRDPKLPVGEVHEGGFGGPDGLAAWLAERRIGAVVDATHPFAARMTASAVEAVRRTGLPLLILRRPGWQAGPGDDWRRVPSLEAAAALLPALGERVFLTTGRRSLPVFADLDGLWFLARSVDPPEPPLPRRVEVLLSRGPFTREGELALMRGHRIDVLVTKDSGGQMTTAKLHAARELGLPVVVVQRPPAPGGVPAVPTVGEAVAWLETVAGAAG